MTPPAAGLHDPQTLYRQWEYEQWNPWQIDLGTDREQSRHALNETDKALVYWALSSLMVAEERITTKFAGLVMAAETEEEASFLASQQVDEARHMQFYARVQDEVIAQPAEIAAHLQRSREQLGESFRVIFDQALRRAAERPLLADEIRATLRELLPAATNALAPPNREGTDFEALGATSDDIRQFALDGLTRRLKIIGVPLETL